MLAIRKKAPVHDRKVTIEIPESFGDLVEIIILSDIEEKEVEYWSKDEIDNFGKSERKEFLHVSESSLQKDWNRSEEDTAWKNL